MILGTGEDTGANYQQMTMPASEFIDAYHQFREIMGSKKYDLEYKENAFSALTYIYLNIRQDDSKLNLCINAFVVVSEEFSRRKVMMLFAPEIH